MAPKSKSKVKKKKKRLNPTARRKRAKRVKAVTNQWTTMKALNTRKVKPSLLTKYASRYDKAHRSSQHEVVDRASNKKWAYLAKEDLVSKTRRPKVRTSSPYNNSIANDLPRRLLGLRRS